MYRDKKRYGQDPATVVRSASATFLKPLKWQREVERGIRTGHDRLVFTCSWSDWFIEEADNWRPEAWDIVRATPGLIYQILTKRPERIADHLPSFWQEIRVRCWLGTSIEDQAAMDLRGPIMRAFGWQRTETLCGLASNRC
jgi:protein gp37